MQQVSGNIWDFHSQGRWIVITTNGYVSRCTGKAVMGRGVALECAQRFPSMPLLLGNSIKTRGNVVASFPFYNIFSFPVKHHYGERADLDLIEQSGHQLVEIVEAGKYYEDLERVYLPRPGCRNGRRTWEEVEPRLWMLGNRFVVVDLP